MGASASRLAALEVLTRVRERVAYAHETLDAVLDPLSLDPRDAAFATRLAYGAIASRGTLDEAVTRFVDRPERIENRVLDALALTAYELLFMRTPARAAVNEGVELVRAVAPKASGLANAVLRKLATHAESFPWGDPEADDEALARLYGHPRWLADLWIAERGREQAASIMAADNEPAPLFMAHLPYLGDIESALQVLVADGVWPAECPLDGCMVAGEPSAARRSSAVSDGRVLVMDAGAQLAVQAVRPEPGMRIVEIGAGRGTKSVLLAGMAEAQGGEAEVIAVDVHGFKLERLAALAEKVGARCLRTVTADATADLSENGIEPESADVVLVDAPCSGLGTLRRHPDRRWRAQPGEVESLAALGSRLLERASSLVKPGGFVVYSTCTIARQENEDVVEGFLASPAGSSFSTARLAEDVPEEWRHFVTAEGWFQSLPEPGGPDGHFVARLVRG